MSVTIEQDLKEIFSETNQKLERIDNRLTNLDIGQARLEEKFDNLSKRIDNQEFVSCGILIGLIITIVGGFAKLFGLVSNP